MKRRQLFQLTDQDWCPPGLARLVDEFLVWFVGKTRAAKPFVPVVERALERAGTRRIIDLRLGVGSGAHVMRRFLPADVVIETYDLDDLDAIPAREGVYVIANGFHRLPGARARRVLGALVARRASFVVVEGNNDHPWQAVGMFVFVPLTALLTAPFVQPFRLSRLLLTYLLPVLPLLLTLDGAAALFKLYAPADMDELFGELAAESYGWRSGKAANGRGGKILYAVGHPDPSARARDRCGARASADASGSPRWAAPS
ncbi:MAG: hypothetical protein AAGH15_00800 [Myxococcota bacterium]